MPPQPPDLPPDLASDPFRTADAHAAGLTRWNLEHRPVRRLHHGVYLENSVVLDLVTRCRGALLALPEGSILSHHTAAEMRGLPVPEPGRIHAVVPTLWTPRHSGIVAHRGPRDVPHELIRCLPVTLAARTWVDLAAVVSRIELIILGDAMLRHELVTKRDLTAACGAAQRRRGVQAARAALEHLHERVDSPMETRLRMILVDAGLPCPLVNVPVRDEAGHLLCVPDLHYLERRVALQYEGDHHRTDKAQWRSDIDRDDVMRGDSWEVLRFVDFDVFTRPDRTVDRVRRALNWTGPLTPPPPASPPLATKGGTCGR